MSLSLKVDKTGFYIFYEALEAALKAGKGQAESFDAAKSAYERAAGEPCPFSVVRSCLSCKHFDGKHCFQWGADVPADAVERGCEAHAFVTPNHADIGTEPTPF